MNYEAGQMGDDDRLALPDYEDRPRRRRRWFIIGAVVVVLIVALIGFKMAGSGKKDAAATATAAAGNDQIPTVTVSVPGREIIAHSVTANGTLAARREMPVGVAGEGGRITRVLVEPGDWVGAGQVLATVDRSVQTQTAASLAAQIKVAQADARLAQADLDRAEKLVSRGFISQADIDNKTATRDAMAAKVRVAQATLAEAQARTGQLDIRAPAAGLVLTRAAEPGQIVGAGSGVLFRMAKGGEMEMRAQLSEADLASLAVGVPAKVTPVGGTKSYDGQVWQVSPVIDPQTRQGIARIALSYHADLRPGGFASATIRSGSAQAPLLPESAVLSDDQGNYVYVVGEDNKVVRRNVKTGEVSDAGVAIAEGLSGTERVVMSAGAFLNAGQKVIPVLQKSQG